jgi:O-acetylserine/cysteine efflux transporter
VSPLQLACALLVPLIWGYQYVVIKAGLVDFPPLFFVGIRFVIMALLLLPFIARPTRREVIPIALIALFLGVLNFGFFYVGIGLSRGTIAAVAYQLSTPFAILLAWPILQERPSLRQWAGVAIAFAGVAVLAAGPGLRASLFPTSLIIASAFSFAVSNVLTKRFGPFQPLMLVGWSSLFAAPVLLLVSLTIEHGQRSAVTTADPQTWLALVYTILIGGVFAYGLWFGLIARCSINRVAPFGLLLPVFAFISSVLFLGEHLTPPLVAGALLSIVGVAVTQV